ncbi:RagB/SusD family nutrient uptake outer membrane protein [Chitinophaga pendula]|uniref:RagB/SusD family nutrient uptake outer membrane protein n=1 Tax=Chitinophaga TaxID=79328 RepID=UPI0018E04346|nr:MULTISPECIES: RagB/SusD family nutrient uptake outer membrane protein [Chitinophaga]UCJ07708.1 RagB/SusD family nutrient uptake outer membrane protein [Chitinophaga pendula]
MHRTYTLLLLLLVSVVSSCNKLLDIKPVNSMVPVSLEDYESVLLGGYPRTDFFMKTELMTDNVYANLITLYNPTKEQELWFTWAPTKQLDGVETDPNWGQLYSSIFYANTVLDHLSNYTPQVSERERYETVKGEAYALRAFSYFYLVNLYAEPYSTSTLESPGVPMPLEAKDVLKYTQNNTRATVGKVYEQIKTDIGEAARLLAGKKSSSKFRFDAGSVQLFRARVALFTGQYDVAIQAATDVMTNKPLADLNTLQPRIDDKGNINAFSGNTGFIDTDYKNEVLFFMGGSANTNMYYYSQYMFKPSPELLLLCNRQENVTDYRKYIFSSFADLNTSDGKQTGSTMYNMYAKQENPSYFIGLKVSEAYVIRAEAYARQQQYEAALSDINTLLGRRIKRGQFVALRRGDFASNDAILQRILEERRLETAFDGGLRWMDLRRLGRPALVHVFKNGQTYELKKNDNRYLLQIPVSEQINSPEMPINP